MEISAKQKIVLATIECIEKEGINSVTIRSIGREAGVNSAAISYYFGSKEKLIEEAFDYIQKDLMMDFTNIINKDSDLKDIVEELLLYMLQGTIKYPNIARAVLYEPFINNNYNTVFITRINALCEELYNKINKHHKEDKNKNKAAIVQLIASSLFLGVFPGAFQDFSGINLRDEKVLEEYAARTADIFTSIIN
jgi:AcrR family transcriptional regulator